MPVDSVEAAQAWRTERQNIAQRKPLPSAVEHPQRPIIVAREVGDFPTEDHDSARTRLRIAEANQAEMVEAEMRRDLIRVSAVRSSWARWVSSLADALDQLAPRMTPVLVAESDPGKMHALIQAEADGIKRLLSSMRLETDS